MTIRGDIIKQLHTTYPNYREETQRNKWCGEQNLQRETRKTLKTGKTLKGLKRKSRNMIKQMFRKWKISPKVSKSEKKYLKVKNTKKANNTTLLLSHWSTSNKQMRFSNFHSEINKSFKRFTTKLEKKNGKKTKAEMILINSFYTKISNTANFCMAILVAKPHKPN